MCAMPGGYAVFKISFREGLINSVFVMPAKAGIQFHINFLDSGSRAFGPWPE
jgi:hypothetical protein